MVLQPKVELKFIEEKIDLQLNQLQTQIGFHPVILFSNNTFQSLYDQDNDGIVDNTQHIVNKYICGETINGGIPVVLINDKIYKARADNDLHFKRVIGVSKQAGVQNEKIEVVEKGIVNANVQAGNTYWLATNGGLTNQIPSTGFVQSIGFCEKDNELFVNISEPIRR